MKSYREPRGLAQQVTAVSTATVTGALAVIRAVGALPALVTEIHSVVAAFTRLERRVADLLDRVEPMAAAIAAVDTASPTHAADLLARSGPLLDQIDTVLMPLLRELHEAIPDVRDILPVVQRLEPVMVDFETRMAGLPGSARMRRRGEQVIEDAQAEDAERDTDDRDPV